MLIPGGPPPLPVCHLCRLSLSHSLRCLSVGWYVYGPPSRDPALRSDTVAEAFTCVMVVSAGAHMHAVTVLTRVFNELRLALFLSLSLSRARAVSLSLLCLFVCLSLCMARRLEAGALFRAARGAQIGDYTAKEDCEECQLPRLRRLLVW